MPKAPTPGPWTVVCSIDQMTFEDTTVCILNYRQSDKKYFVGSAYSQHGDEEATAKLIAAAPDLLTAAILARSNLLTTEPGYAELNKAIQKATL